MTKPLPRGVAPDEPSATPAPTGVSVVMPVRNEASHIRGAIASVQAAAGTRDDIEVIVVDGMSDDGTRAIVNDLAAGDPRIRLLDNPKGTVPHAMNIGVKAAAGDVVIRLDGHAEVEVDFIDNALAVLAEHPECACVGGTIQNVNDGPVAEAISQAMSSLFGVGAARFRTGGQDGYVDTLAFGAYRKADLIRVGLFDEELTRNQDDELNYRLVRSGRRIWFSNRIRARYYVRSSFAKLYRQYFQYGYWKVYVNRKHRNLTNFRQLAPPLFIGGLAALLLLAPLWPAALTLLALVAAAYCAAALSFALAGRAGSLRSTLLVVVAFLTLHFGYGLGYWAGLFDFAVLRGRPRPTHELTSH